jgi:hypothetical protein
MESPYCPPSRQGQGRRLGGPCRQARRREEVAPAWHRGRVGGACAAAAVLLALSARAEPAPGWVERAHRKGVTVYSRNVPGTPVEEMLGVGEFPVPPAAAWAVLMNLAGYQNTMPFTVESRVLGEEEQGRVRYFYTVVSPPLIAARDYTLRVAVDQTPEHDQGHGRFTWAIANDYPKAPPPHPGFVRLQLNSGFWDLRPTPEGTTRAILYLRTDPGGKLPGFAVDLANLQAIPGTFAAVAKASTIRLPFNAPSSSAAEKPLPIPSDLLIPTSTGVAVHPEPVEGRTAASPAHAEPLPPQGAGSRSTAPSSPDAGH